MTLEAHAKVNLTLEVFGARSDGYHALRSVVVPISAHDTLSIESSEGSVECDTGYSDDLCIKAAHVLDPTRGATIHVEKRIPAGGGLGGGSADAAVTLIALNALWGKGLGAEELARLGARVGSDVPALVLANSRGGAVLMTGRGEDVAWHGPCPPLWLVLANPGVFSSTPAAYAACTPRDAQAPDASAAVLAALRRHDLAGIAADMVNDLESPAESLHPEIAALRRRMAALPGIVKAQVSGSGASVFGLATTRETAECAVSLLAHEGLAAQAVQAGGEAHSPGCPLK